MFIKVAIVQAEARKEQALLREQAKASERQERFAFRELLDESALNGVIHARSSWSTVLFAQFHKENT
jgi:type VI protein secretion system component VasF